ncbi:hypothetical protein EPICR_20423 [Candidatus Desulfarcum epimagneticum]|uniref:Carrier domain-containing protein n=1 Tax=uncultured Desulfobacteraceae bacterium TaxID=218296 RepID=A0A484HHR0_9BACT|nr:hypothetical protein EPICR_20423 [uncultured Desulfobacteraceae bacterium]
MAPKKISPETLSLIEKKLGKKIPTQNGPVKSKHLPGDVLPLSFSQTRLWFLDRLDPGLPLYNTPKAWRLKGLLNINALEKSIDHILARHESLRAVFTDVNGSPAARVLPSGPNFKLEPMDLRDIPDEKRETKAHDILWNEAKKPFDLGRGPLFRTLLIKISDSEHILFFNIHHIVFDGWSAGILARELSAAYNAFSNGDIPRLDEPPVQYADFALWQRERLKGEIFQTQLSYWKKKLKDAPALLELPADFPRSPAQTHEGALETFTLPGKLSRDLKNLSQREEATLFMTLLTAFNILLSRYTGQEDILVGSPIAGRKRKEVEGVMGFFVNTLVLRSDLSGDPTFLKLLAKTKETCLEAYENQDIPFEKLVEELSPERNLSHSPIFQTLFALQNAPGGDLDLPGLEVEPVLVDIGVSKFDLSLSLAEKENGISARFEFNADIFKRETIQRMAGHFTVLLKGVTASPNSPVSNLPILTQAERRRILTEWNDTQADYPKDKCVHQLFEEQALKTPDATAVVFEDEKLTYRELNERSNQLARYLISLGVGPEVLVGICMERSIEMITGLLGILKSGGAYAPFDPLFPRERIDTMIEESEVEIILTQTALEKSVQKDGVQTICVDKIKPDSTDGANHADLPTGPENRVYVMFTSGSTGKPKGVQIRHKNVVNLLHSIKKTIVFSPKDILLSVTTMAFDISVLEFFLPLCSGGKLVITSRQDSIDGAKLQNLLSVHHVTVMQATPSTWKILEKSGWEGNLKLKALCGGEALPQNLSETLSKKTASLWNMYGPTETTIWSTIKHIRPKDRVSIGRPVYNTSIYILDSQLQPVPIGIAGTLHIGGAGVSSGYLKRPGMTSKSFILNPFNDAPGSRLYKTGDRARWLADGNIEFLGRMDDQLKIRGFRVEPGEIETILARRSDIKEARVEAIDLAPDDRRLTAYLVCRKGKKPGITDLKNILKQRLPDYMIPAFFVFLDAMPLSPNGKIDRKALPEPDMSRPDGEKTFQAPRSPLEKTLAEVWSKVLKIEKIGIYDNFFELGGHSLLGVGLVAGIENATGRPLPLKALFKFSNVADMARAIESGEASTENSSAWTRPKSVGQGLSEEEYRKMLTLVAGIEPPAAKPGFIVTRINDGDLNPPLFWCEPGSSQPDFIKYMDRRQPIYGLYSGIGILYPRTEDQKTEDGWGKKIPVVAKKLAQRYLDQILELNPKGAFALGGACVGGRVAAEIALGLIEMGKKVEALFLVEFFDPFLFEYPEKMTLFFSQKSRSEIHETFRWSKPGWEKPFRAAPEVRWIPGDHHETLIEPNLKVVSEEIRKFLGEHTLPGNKRPMRTSFISRAMKAVSKGSGAWLFLKIIAKCVKSPLAMISSLSAGNFITLWKAMRSEDSRHINANIETYLQTKKNRKQ